MKKYDFGFAVAGSVMCILFFVIVNILTSSNHPWAIYPSFAILIWPIVMYCLGKMSRKLFSIFVSGLVVIFLSVVNYLYTPEHFWVLYAVFPLIWWPILVSLGNKAGSMVVAWIGCGSTILYYIDLNVLLSPGYPWAIYPAFAVLWWPLCIYHAKKKSYFAFSIQASLLISAFFITVNIVSSLYTIWAVYPIFCVLWWPLSMYYYVYKRKIEQ